MGMADVGERSAIGVIGVAQVKEVLVETLELQDRAAAIDASTPLFGSLPEFDSLAVLELIVELERRFGITIEGDDVTAAVFESLASLTEFVDGKAHEAG